MIYRDAIESDLIDILNIMNDAILNTTSIYDYKERSIDYISNWWSNKTKESLPIVVCELESKVVAYGSFGIFRQWEAYKFSIEHSIYVMPNYQRHGIGKEMLKLLISKAKKEGYHTMIGGIDSMNTQSIELHKKFGFVEIGKIKEVGYKFDKWLDLVFMQLIL
jgi:phosphinothricin acetyltransferase